MTVHELIEKLQAIPNQNMEVYYEDFKYGEQPVEKVKIKQLYPSKETAVVFNG